MQYTLLKDVSRQTFRWKILVRLARLWEFRDPQTGTTLYELDFVVIERQGGIMEGYIPNNRIEQFKDHLKEGSVYTIEQFVLSDARRLYKSAEHPYRIRFTQRTKIMEILAVPDNFPLFAYNVQPYNVLSARINNNTLLSDVVGLITALTEVSTSPTTQQIKRQIFITDGSQRVIVTLWGNHAEAFDGNAIQKLSEHKPVIVIFVGMTVSQFSGMLAFKSTSVTKWYINIPTSEVAATKEATKECPHQIEWQGSSRPKDEPSDITLADLMASSPYSRIGDRFRLQIQLIDLVTKDNWWFLSCKSCWKKLQPDGDNFKCPRCSDTKGEPRYKLVFARIDLNNDDTKHQVVGHFTFMGQEGVTIVGKDEVLLVPDPTIPLNNIPPHILSPVGRKYVLTAELSDNSLDSDNLCFQVNSVEEIYEHPVPQDQDQQSGSSTIVEVSAVETTDQESAHETQLTPPSAVGKELEQSPPDETLLEIAGRKGKNTGTGQAKSKETTPTSKKRTRSGVSKALFSGEQSSTGADLEDT